MKDRHWIDRLIPEGYDIFDAMMFALIFGVFGMGCVMAIIDYYCKACGK